MDHKLRRKQPPISLSDYEIEERAANAESLLGDVTFLSAVDEVYSRALGTLIDAEVGSLTASTAHATLKALEEIHGQLEQYVTDRKMRQKYPKMGEKNG